MGTSSTNDPEGCDERGDREAASVPAEVTESSGQDQEAGGGEEEGAAPPWPVGGKGDISRFQGK